MPCPKSNPKKKGKVVGEKWLTESMQHSREFHNASVEVPEVVAEFTVDKKSYKNIREKSILQKRSRNAQPTDGTYHNIYNKKRIPDQFNKLNLGL
jgi:hypothetical protein